MVDMNPEHIFEVPDTPDRIQQSACPVSSSAATRGVTRMAGNPPPSRSLKFKIKTNSTQGQSSRGDAISERPTALDTDNFFMQAELARKLDRTTGKSVMNGNGAHSHDLDKSSSISGHMIRRGDGVRGNSCQIREGKVGHQDASHRHVNSLGVGSDLPNITVVNPQNRARISTSNGLKEAVGSDVEKREAISSTPCDVPQRQGVRRRLVRNGCISPSSVVKRSVIADEKREICSTSGVLHYPNPQDDVFHKGNIIDLTDKSPTMTKNGVSVNYMETTASEKFRRARAGGTLIPQSANHASSSNSSEGFNNKGKETIHHMGTERAGEADTTRVCPRAAVGPSSVVNDNNTDITQQGWRTTHNHYSKLPMSLLGKMTSTSGMESGSSGPSNQGHETTAGDNNSFSTATTMRSASLRSRTIRISNRKRKHTSSSCHPGESSSSLNEVGGSCLASSDTTAGRNHTTLRHSIPVINIDEISSPEVRSNLRGLSNGTSSDPNISAQLEADELLARQLQEQLYNETPRVAPREEIDAIVAMSLQHEEDAERTSRTVRAPVRRLSNNTRAARASRLSASQRAIRARYEPVISHMRNAAPITLGWRAFVAGYPASHIQPNIDLNDYDALLALDENNHQHTGASESQINNLPQSVFQSTSTEEPCAVCLENPSFGDTIRTLPCFHKFHKECIDEWLRRKKLCPVCKCGIAS